MNRTAEMVLTSIGLAVYAIMSFFSFRVMSLKDNEEIKNQIEQGLNSNPDMQGAGNVSVDKVLDFLFAGATFVLIMSLIGLILGILTIIFLRGDKKPKAAGIILIITAIVTTLLTIVDFFGGIFYLIAGITALVRKSKNKTVTESSAESY
ncbi:DUF4064 domain-containing protein [Halobacillus salinarum]|uniref:DUF4064 domain-containing protein n=1 Tax=Halobacillus salinarum TaxID=2932257 RepID=A0ABY4EJ60_9BACI|nr:DUF4064 domain-containing protein [Halobacillus salinarum]UOQ44475.1 DUF4064 domain-containing protein [Halobacillus salinarum]